MAKGVLITVILLSASLQLCRAGKLENEKCSTLSAYDRFEDTTSCNKYWECDATKTAQTKICEYGLGFDPETKSCTWKNYVSSCANVAGDMDCASVTIETKKNCANAKMDYDAMLDLCVLRGSYVCKKGERVPDCTDVAHKGKFIADKTNCAGYFRCDNNGVRYSGECPTGYFFNPDQQQCSYASSLKNCKPVLSKGSQYEIDFSSLCRGKAGTFVADPRTCWGYVYCSTETSGRPDFCSDGKFFNNGVCSKTPPSTCGCEIYGGTLKAGEEQTAPHADPNQYYLCKLGEQIPMKCPSGTYDADVKSCKV